MRARVSVAVNASELRIVGRNLVAVGAVRTMVRNLEPSVIKRRACPGRGRMATVASRWIAGGEVVRNRTTQSCRAVPVVEVAAVARGIGGGQRIVVTDVAQVAGGGQVIASEGPTG